MRCARSLNRARCTAPALSLRRRRCSTAGSQEPRRTRSLPRLPLHRPRERPAMRCAAAAAQRAEGIHVSPSTSVASTLSLVSPMPTFSSPARAYLASLRCPRASGWRRRLRSEATRRRRRDWRCGSGPRAGAARRCRDTARWRRPGPARLGRERWPCRRMPAVVSRRDRDGFQRVEPRVQELAKRRVSGGVAAGCGGRDNGRRRGRAAGGCRRPGSGVRAQLSSSAPMSFMRLKLFTKGPAMRGSLIMAA